jgi:hypothetical protein
MEFMLRPLLLGALQWISFIAGMDLFFCQEIDTCE